jgi:hypothetical protein
MFNNDGQKVNKQVSEIRRFKTSEFISQSYDHELQRHEMPSAFWKNIFFN